MEQLIEPIAYQMKISTEQVKNTLELLEMGNTVPFIARYRKEVTKGLDEEQIYFIEKEYRYQQNLQKRKEDVLRIIETQGKLTDEIKAQVNACLKLSEVEDIYRPYQQKRKTRATEAIKNGLEPFALWLMSCPRFGSVEEEAKKYLKDPIQSVEEAIQGAKDIVAEKVSDDAKVRRKIKDSIFHYAWIITKEKKNHNDEKKIYQMYYDRKEKLNNVASHRIMAIDRAENEKVISVSLEYDQQYLINYAVRGICKNRDTIAQSVIEEAVSDGLKRLAFPSVEREIRNELSEKAQEKSIEIFSMNVERLLLQPPLKGRMILGVDPAFRTGCKLAVVDSTGKMITISVIYPHSGANQRKEAAKELARIIKEYKIEILAIGNGTASRETESFVAEVIRDNDLNVSYTLVSEAGASVYSASELARKEFPDLHVEQRSAVSIARRLLDPLSELIKIDPKSIGVGQYQHDLPKKELNDRLDFVVSKAVNRVGVDVNTASVELLMHISGLNKSTAQSIVDERNEKGRFTDRGQLKKVKKLGAKSFQQAAGFLRITEGKEILDETSIHPESYEAAKKLMKELQIHTLGEPFSYDENQKYELCAKCNIDEYTFEDILDSLQQPTRDYREQYDGPMLRSDVLELKDLKIGDKLEGVVRNVVDFGAFVDIGLHDDGLIHISKMSKERISHPSELVEVGDIVTVWVSNIDEFRQKVQLSLIEDE